MFNVPTVFILGAGASWHYGYPTGDTLVDKVISRSLECASYFASMGRAPGDSLVSNMPKFVSAQKVDNPSAGIAAMRARWSLAAVQCAELAERLSLAYPPVIDYFLGGNSDLATVGKFMVAWIILDAEHNSIATGKNSNRRSDNEKKDSWYRFVLYKMLSGYTEPGKVLENEVAFITFNYDVSLEYSLYHGLNSYEPMRPHISKFREKFAPQHVYGSVRPNTDGKFKTLGAVGFGSINSDVMTDHLDLCRRMNVVFDAAQSIQTIAPKQPLIPGDLIKRMRDLISRAQEIFILGYGFDEQNSALLDLQAMIRAAPPRKTVYFTNYEDQQRVRRRAGRLFQTGSQFFSDNRAISNNNVFEMSTSNVYDAFAKDFEFPD